MLNGRFSSIVLGFQKFLSFIIYFKNWLKSLRFIEERSVSIKGTLHFSIRFDIDGLSTVVDGCAAVALIREPSLSVVPRAFWQTYPMRVQVFPRASLICLFV